MIFGVRNSSYSEPNKFGEFFKESIYIGGVANHELPFQNWLILRGQEVTEAVIFAAGFLVGGGLGVLIFCWFMVRSVTGGR